MLIVIYTVYGELIKEILEFPFFLYFDILFSRRNHMEKNELLNKLNEYENKLSELGRYL